MYYNNVKTGILTHGDNLNIYVFLKAFINDAVKINNVLHGILYLFPWFYVIFMCEIIWQFSHKPEKTKCFKVWNFFWH